MSGLELCVSDKHLGDPSTTKCRGHTENCWLRAMGEERLKKEGGLEGRRGNCWPRTRPWPSWAPGRELCPAGVSPRAGRHVPRCYSPPLPLAGATEEEWLGVEIYSDTSDLRAQDPGAQS